MSRAEFQQVPMAGGKFLGGPVVDQQHLAFVEERFLHRPRKRVQAAREQHNLLNLAVIGLASEVEVALK